MHDPLDWLIFKLVDDGAQMNLKGQFGDNLLFEVTPKPTTMARGPLPDGRGSAPLARADTPR